MERSREIADFLRTRRAAIAPELTGLPADGRVRRVPGLRRDEVARLAGVSTEYYTRLEQGRAGRPSTEVVQALARALRLDPSEREHLADLLLPAEHAARRAPERPQRVRPGLHLMLETLAHVPAFVLGRRTDVLAANRLAREVLTDFDALPATRRNMARYYLLDPQARERVGDWATIAAETVAMLRLEAGRHPDDRRLAELIGELTLRCPEFTTWWNDHRVLRRTHGAKHYVHPLVGDLHFSYESFQAPGDPDQTLCVYSVEPASPTADALRLLAGWNAPAAT
ncbi:helix-turn-helix transcriptional regulator [Kitasatospora sp. YST-16]|uniref:helix-turn-helix domain-containing protein n=1 Tax=unclassified Kitasatospora TaxID=2633591 RepID=UPI0004C45AA2|nr:MULTISPECIES: helix-turn-helix transcriptional regulator [unclassified Kitasatospora]WAL73222.1 helix-turn-helix transcriptional regulator [Kitasatospora sp. YST-16]WNW39276.1 helix-turn-helix transcriptional regulator [Streptomyces sp. Li-HN-5-13]